MSLKERLASELKDAMRAGNVEQRDTIRLLQAAIKQEEVDSRTTLDETAVLAVLQKQAKQRRESIADYQKADRPELAAEEERQLLIIQQFLPQMMSREEIETLVRQLLAETGVTDAKGMGQIMAKLMPQVKDKADGRLVNEVVRALLTAAS